MMSTEAKSINPNKYMNYVPNNETWTITFGECVENHAGMQKIGETSDEGFDIKELENAAEIIKDQGFDVELIKLNEYLPENMQDDAEEAAVLVVRDGIKMFFNEEKEKEIEKESKDIDEKDEEKYSEYDEFVAEVYATKDIVDKKAWMKGRVVNKKARYNLCYADYSQKADFENKKGTIINFDNVKKLEKIRKKLPELLGDKAKNLFAELNYYYYDKAYIGWHGDTERSRVIGLRLGSPFSLMYNWYQMGNPIGEKCEFVLYSGDFYIMSHKAVGTDWKKRKICTLRHAAGNV